LKDTVGFGRIVRIVLVTLDHLILNFNSAK
jgi:hypothetical protein